MEKGTEIIKTLTLRCLDDFMKRSDSFIGPEECVKKYCEFYNIIDKTLHDYDPPRYDDIPVIRG